jgi:hypothetical protein
MLIGIWMRVWLFGHSGTKKSFMFAAPTALKLFVSESE